ncbi:MAG: PAS domain S-box protein [Bacteroidales bacterium]|nr:PAS domain S-box protein [Bacteroidales bacterium]MCF8343218.1 PAS domain S-box protein [Bacteroidales bacterium]MCF8351337.1 PAS domain S-box protein [Bacteroidales bacterium]MCF8376885.1 PAS domain S-box protein [Bacteroidales bacterium]MCF8401510.1 PAS domain S-box protein [Bacteroidales bacterium]
MDEAKIRRYYKLTKKQLISKIIELQENAGLESEKGTEPEYKEENIRLIYENSYDIIWQMNEKLERLETERSRILDSLDDLFFYYDKDLRIKILNQAAVNYLGHRAHKCIGEICYTVWREGQDAHCWNCHVLESLENKKTNYREVKVGEKIYRFKSVPVKNKNGGIIGVAEFGQDITKVREAENALKTSERRYRLLTETARDIICIHGLKGEIKYLNQAGLNLIGKGPHNVIGSNVMDYVAPSYRKKTIARQQKRMKDEKAIFLYESVFINSDGDYIPVEVSSSIMRSENKEDDVLIVARDISERKKAAQKIEDYSKDLEQVVNKRTSELKNQKEDLEKSQLALTYLLEDVNESREAMNRINKKLEEVNKELEAFSYSVSHDLKAPLRAIDGFSQILLEDYTDKLNEDGKRYLRIVRENTQKMGDLIQDLLDFSRAGRKKLKKRKLDLQSITHDVVNEVSKETAERKLSFDIAPLPKVEGDENLIRQVLFNLISNAVKFTRNESESQIKIKAEENDAYHWISVKDNGVGFDMKYVDKLFNVFQRLHTVDQFEGTGVGLALVKRIVKKHGGEVKAEAKPGLGACFSFSLPKTYAE